MMSATPLKLNIIGCIGKVDSVDDFIRKAQDFVSSSTSKKDILLQFFDADKVLGKEHVLSAIKHAKRAFEREENISATMAMEILIYAAGEPQIKNALAKIGLKDGCERIAVIVDEDVDFEGLLSHLGLKRDDSVLEFNENKLKAFGITEEEVSVVDKDKIRDLVLERIAMVDVRK